jgi:hypothetical protein
VADTEAAVACTASLAPLVAISFLARRGDDRSPGWGGGLAILGWIGVADVVAWTAAWGGSGRASTLPGAMACFGVALVAPWVGLVLHRDVLPRAWLVGAQLVTILAASRWAARAPDLFEGTLRAVAVLIVLALVCVVSARARGPARPPQYDRPEPPR